MAQSLGPRGTRRAALCYVDLVTPATWARAAICLALLDVAWTSAPAARAPRDRDVLARAGAAVRQYQEELPHLVATETSVQWIEPIEPGRRVEEPARHLVAEFGWVAFPASSDVVGVRDVVEVDGRRLTHERERLQALLHGGDGSAVDARRLVDESARYNLGDGSRNVNLPTVVLFFLHPNAQPRFAWSRKSRPSAAVWEFEFKERERPTIIHSDRSSVVYSHGRVLIDVATGIVLRTELHIRIDKVDYALVTTFAPVAALGLTLPARLEEHYVTPTGVIRGEARYDHYRRFVTEARLLP